MISSTPLFFFIASTLHAHSSAPPESTTTAAAASAECSAATLAAEYNMPLHIAALFTLLALSAIGVFTTLIITVAHKHIHLPPAFLFITRHFGTGIILATAFIHMLPAAMSAFNNPCVAEANEIYGAWAPLLVMVAALFMQGIEFIAMEVTRRREEKADSLRSVEAETQKLRKASMPKVPHGYGTTLSDHCEHEHAEFLNQGHQDHGLGSVASAGAGMRSRKASMADCHETPVATNIEGVQCNLEEVAGVPVHHHTGTHCHADPGMLFLLDANTTARQRLATYILEFGIALHSVLIGLALGVAMEDFIPLWIAICFHQLFEGLALGQRIAQVTPKKALWRGYLMAGVFAITTPVGIAIGIGVHRSFAENAPGMLISSGVLDALATGILLYTAFVHLMGEDMMSSAEFGQLKGKWKLVGFASLWAGATVMAVIGKWA